jgi:adenylate cyclase
MQQITQNIMPVEIERKFLVTGSWQEIAKNCKGLDVRQGYLCKDSNCTTRIRTMNNTGILTIKGKGTGISRPEFEYEVPLAEANELLMMCSGSIVEKTRYFVPVGGKTWELDVFKGDNEGLVVAEIELGSEDETFELPAWAGEEVTHDKRYGNSSLSQNPYKNWQKE